MCKQSHICWGSTVQVLSSILLGGETSCFLFSPLFGEEAVQFDDHIFSDGVVQPPTSLLFRGVFL